MKRDMMVAAGAVFAMALATFDAQAQTPARATDPNMPAPHNTVPDKIEGRQPESTGSTNSLSDKLERSDGVIVPPDTGTGRTIRPPDTGTMPVIPPR